MVFRVRLRVRVIVRVRIRVRVRPFSRFREVCFWTRPKLPGPAGAGKRSRVITDKA